MILLEIEPFSCRERGLQVIRVCEGQGRGSAAQRDTGEPIFLSLFGQKNWGHRGALRLANLDGKMGISRRKARRRYAPTPYIEQRRPGANSVGEGTALTRRPGSRRRGSDQACVWSVLRKKNTTRARPRGTLGLDDKGSWRKRGRGGKAAIAPHESQLPPL